jgi:cytochrome c oxidase assembly protein subunit 15
MINERVEIHFAHRVGALVVTLITLTLAGTIFTYARRHARLTRIAVGLLVVLVMQIALGASVIWLRREPVMTSLHVVNGAAVLATALLLAMRATKIAALAEPEARGWKPASYQEAHA